MEVKIDKKCGYCNRFLKNIAGRKRKIVSLEDAECYSDNLKTVSVGDILCNQCRLKRYRNTQTQISDDDSDICTSVQENDSEFQVPCFANVSTDTELIELPIQRTISSHGYCCLCSSKSDLLVVPQEARTQAFTKRKIYIPKGNRSCSKHIIKNRFFEDDLNQLRIISNTSMLDLNEVSELFNNLALESTASDFQRIGDGSLSNDDIYVFTGLTWANITDLTNLLPSLRNNENRNIIQAVVIFLVKLRTGNSNSLIATMLKLEAHQHVSEYVKSVTSAFENILPQHFGIKANNREDLIANHTTKIAKKICNAYDALILICDGTYARHQKSKNNEYQRKSFSGQKKAPLCKPFTICITNGFVVDMLGPYTANKNDASILKNIIDDESSGLNSLMQPGDIFVLDRGFRDVVTHLEAKGYRVLMPALKGNCKQLPCQEANDSRLVTKIRWPVEAVHGMLKQKNKLLNNTLDNKMLNKIGSLYRIASFLLNVFGKRLESDAAVSDEILNQFSSKMNEENTLATEVENKGWLRKRLPFQSITSTNIIDFPEMTELDMKIFFTGTYQYNQAISYLAETLNEDGSLNLEYVKDHSNILKLKVQSRHISRKTYRCFVEYVPNSMGFGSITRHYCECANGMRTVGCCSHIAAIVYYLSYARYLSNIIRPAEMLSRLFLTHGVSVTVNEDSDSD